MDLGQLLSSLNIFAIIALAITLLVFFIQLKPIIFRKKVSKNPVIPDFDGNVHTLPDDHATHIDVESIESGGGVNMALIMLLLGIMVVLLIIIVGGFLLGKKKTTPTTPTTPNPTAIPTEVIEIGNISPTSPFGESEEIPFDLSGTPILETSTPTPTKIAIGGPTSVILSGSPTSAPGYTKSPSITGASTSASITSQATTTSPTLPVSGNYRIFILLTAIPIILLTLAILL